MSAGVEKYLQRRSRWPVTRSSEGLPAGELAPSRAEARRSYLGTRHPASIASRSEQNQRSPFDVSITVSSYQRLPGV